MKANLVTPGCSCERTRSQLVRTALGIALSTAILGTTPALGVVINANLTFTPRWNDPANWPGATLAERTQNRNWATAVVRQSAINWENSITDPFNLRVDVDWTVPMAYGNQDTGVCGVGGIDTTQMVVGVEKPATAKIILNSNLGNSWFIDPTPLTHFEYEQVPNEPWRGTARPGGPAVNKVDMLSCSKHEFGHTLGFHRDANAGVFTPYILETADGDVDLNDFGGISIPVGNLANMNLASHYRPVGNVMGTLIPVSHLLMVPDMNPAGDERTVQSPYDISGVAKILGLPAGGAYNLMGKGVVVPEPATAGLMGCVVVWLAISRRRATRR